MTQTIEPVFFGCWGCGDRKTAPSGARLVCTICDLHMREVTARFDPGEITMPDPHEVAGWFAGSTLPASGSWKPAEMAFIEKCLSRHANRDWGDIAPEEMGENDLELDVGGILVSLYTIPGSEHKLRIQSHLRHGTTTVSLSDGNEWD